MANIQLLQNGCTGADIINTINAIIARLNDGSGQRISYNDLDNLPTVNGVELKGTLTTASLLIAMSGCSDYQTQIATLATKTELNSMKNQAIAAAQAAAQAELNNKLDKDLGNITAVDYFGKDSMIPIVTDDGVKKTTLANVASYTKIQNETAASAIDTALSKERKTLTIEGEKDGTNKVYTVVEGYKPGTGMLYFNGQLLAPDDDYEETDSSTVTFIHIAPEEGDKITFRAVPAT